MAEIRLEGQTAAHSLVEECMIAANEAVARYMIARAAPTVFRHHEEPAQSRIELLYAQLEELGVPTPPLPGGELGPAGCRRAAADAAREVARYIQARRLDGRALWPLVLRALRQAYYSPAEPGHSGLASPAYLHFTSPIRRYPDLLVHRGLLDALGIGDPGPGPAELDEAADHCSATEREAAAVEHRADAICAAFLLRDRLARARLGRAGLLHGHRPHRRRPLRRLRRGLHRVPAVAAAGGRPLPGRPARAWRSWAPPRGGASAWATSSRRGSCASSRCAGGRSWSPR